MKIVVYKDNFNYGGDTKYFFNLLDSFKKDYQCKILIFSSLKSDKKSEFVLANKNKYKFFFVKKFEISLKALNKFFLYKVINKLNYLLFPVSFLLDFFFFTKKIVPAKPDIVISFNGGYPGSLRSLSFVIISSFFNIKNFLVVASIPSRRNFFFSIYDLLLDFFVKKSATKVIANSKNQIELLNKYRRIPYSKLVVLYNGLKISYQKFKEINFRKKVVNFGIVSRLDKNKKIDILINLFNNFYYKDYTFNLFIIGKGDQEKYLKTLSKNDKNHLVKFLGYKNNQEVANIMRNKVDIYLFSSVVEGMPYSILESINLGVPIISSSAGGGISEIFNNKEDLIILKNFDQNSFNNAVLEYLKSAKIIKKYRTNAYLKLKKNFNLINMQKKFRNLVLNVLKNK
jgi:glycosyltransferase involved in cell wall biosynthesis